MNKIKPNFFCGIIASLLYLLFFLILNNRYLIQYWEMKDKYAAEAPDYIDYFSTMPLSIIWIEIAKQFKFNFYNYDLLIIGIIQYFVIGYFLCLFFRKIYIILNPNFKLKSPKKSFKS